MKVDLSHREGIDRVAPNTFRSIKAGYPIDLHGATYLVLKISDCVKAPASDGSQDRKEARIYLHRLTKSGAYSWTKDACCFAYVRISGYVEEEFKPFLDVTRPKVMWITEYNNLVRSGRETGFARHRHFDISLEEGIKGMIAVESHATWDAWYYKEGN